MSELGERIKTLRGQMSIVNFSAKFGIHRNTLRTYESGERYPDSRLLTAICSEYKVKADWLLLGVGPKERGKAQDAQVDMEVLEDAVDTLEQALAKTGRTMSPSAKAEIITRIYEIYIEEEDEGNKAKISNLLKLVV